MQDEIQVSGIIVSAMPVGETDRRLLLITKELGKISCFARGARKPTSMLVGCTRPFAMGLFYLYAGRDSYTLKRAEIREYFEPIVHDVEKTAYASYFLELAAYFTHDGTGAENMLTLSYYALKALMNPKIEDALVRRIFEISVLGCEGFLPDFSTCCKCGKELSRGYFLTALMEPACEACVPDRKDYPLSAAAVYTFRFIAGTAPGKLFTFILKPEVLEEVSAVTEILLNRVLDRTLPAREMLSVLVS